MANKKGWRIEKFAARGTNMAQRRSCGTSREAPDFYRSARRALADQLPGLFRLIAMAD
jgi:hypothetical protein